MTNRRKNGILTINNVNLAMGIRWLTNETFHKRDGVNNSTIYTFLENEKTVKAFEALINLREEFK